MSRPALEWSDPTAVSKWLAGLRVSFNDADAAALDMLRPLRARELGPALHAKNYTEARAQILEALDYAGAPGVDGGPVATRAVTESRIDADYAAHGYPLATTETPIAPAARAVRLVNQEPPDTARWRVEVDGAPVCDVDITIDTRSGFTYFRIFAPLIDTTAEDVSPRLLRSGDFDRGSPWWTPDMLRGVLHAIVRGSIAPAAVEITIEGAPDAD